MASCNLWQKQGTQEMERFLLQFFSDPSITRKGSLLNPESLDVFSDVDLEIHLKSNDILNIPKLLSVLEEQIGEIFGYEIHSNASESVIRIVFCNFEAFDLSFFHDAIPVTMPNTTFEDKIINTVMQFWFIAYMAIIKIGRKDYLIASHLALELCQLIIVLQMLERDKNKNTNFHRFGKQEDVPILHNLIYAGNDKKIHDKKDEILSVLFEAAEYMDNAVKHLGFNIANYIKLKEKAEELLGEEYTLNKL